MFYLTVVKDEASLPCLQNPLPYLIMSNMNPVHSFITHLFTISCTHPILLLCWNILKSHLKFQILYRPVDSNMHLCIKQNLVYAQVSKMFFTLNPTEFLCFSYSLSLLHKHNLVQTWNYELSNSIHHSFTSSLLGFNFLLTLLLNALNLYSFLNMRHQVSNKTKQHVKLYIT